MKLFTLVALLMFLFVLNLYIMKESSTSIKALLPVLFGFFIMGFCDVVGIATSYVKADFGLSETIAGFLPSMVFLWFLLLAVPAAIFMNRIGRKKTVLVSMLVTIVGMIIPFIDYNLYTCLIAFALLGIGNTILQVSLNPLLTNVVKGNVLASSLTAGAGAEGRFVFLRSVYRGIRGDRTRKLAISFPDFRLVDLDFHGLVNACAYS